MKNRVMIKNNKGITLIALVVTIIMIIILSGVVIGIVLKDNGIRNKAKEVDEKQKIATLSEQLELLKAPILIDEQKVKLEVYLSKLKEYNEKHNIINEVENDIDKVDEYNAYAILEGKYKFLIRETENEDVIIKYQGVVGKLKLSETSGTLEYPQEKTIKIISNESEGKISVKILNEEIATVTLIDEETIKITSKETAGTTKIIVTSQKTEKYEENRATYTLIVKNGEIEVIVSDYEGTYTGSGHQVEITTNPTDAKIEYSKDEKITYSEEKPEYTDAGNYTVYYRVSKTGYVTKEGSFTVTIGQGTNTLELSETSGTYTYPTSGTFEVKTNVSGGKISVTSSNENIARAEVEEDNKTITVYPGTTAGEATLTVTSVATTNYEEQTVTYKATVGKGTLDIEARGYRGVYDGNAHGVTVTCNIADAIIEYSEDGESYDSEKPTYINAGTYTTHYKVTKAGYTTIEASLTSIIDKAEGKVELSTATGNLTYPNTTTFTIDTNTSEGTISLASTNNNIATATLGNDKKTVTVHSGTTVGEATITVTSAETANYNEASTTYKVTVANGTLDVEASGYSGTYDEKAHGITVTCNTSGATITYSSDGTTYSGTKPTYTNAGTYTTYYKVTKAGYTTVTDSKTVTIAKKAGSVELSATTGDLTYPNTTTFTIDTITGDGTISLKTSSSAIATATLEDDKKTVTVKAGTTSGEATITVTSAATTNYNAASATYKVTVANGTLTVTATPYSGEYDGQAHKISVTCSGATITYSDGTKDSSGNLVYSATNPTYTAVGTYTTYYKVVKAGYTTVTGNKTVTIKDTNVPLEAEITISGETSQTTLPISLSATVTHSDEASGIDIEACRYIFNTSNTELGTTVSNYTGGEFKTNGETITIEATSTENWYLHVLSVDKSGNATETIKGPITITTNYHTHSEDTCYTEGTVTETCKVTSSSKTLTYASNYNELISIKKDCSSCGGWSAVRADVITYTHKGCGKGTTKYTKVYCSVHSGWSKTSGTKYGSSHTYSKTGQILECTKEEGTDIDGYTITY